MYQILQLPSKDHVIMLIQPRGVKKLLTHRLNVGLVYIYLHLP